jgi:hypothetical protein
MAEEAPKSAFTPEQLESLDAKMGTMFNNAIASRLSTFEKKILEKTGGGVADALKAQLPELLKQFAPSATQDEPGSTVRGKKDVEIETLKKKLEETSARAEATDKRLTEERAQSRKIVLRQKVMDGLAEHGIDGVRAKAAIASFNDDGRVQFAADDADDVTFRSDDGNDVDLNFGLKSWVKTEQAKLFLPPAGVRGAGTRPGGTGAPAAANKDEAVKQFWEAVGQSVRNG